MPCGGGGIGGGGALIMSTSMATEPNRVGDELERASSGPS